MTIPVPPDGSSRRSWRPPGRDSPHSCSPPRPTPRPPPARPRRSPPATRRRRPSAGRPLPRQRPARRPRPGAAPAPAAQLRVAAESHGADMVAHRFFAHVSPSAGAITDRARRAGYVRGDDYALGEDIAWGEGDLSHARSDRHRLDEQPAAPRRHPRRRLPRVGVGVVIGTSRRPQRDAGAVYVARRRPPLTPHGARRAPLGGAALRTAPPDTDRPSAAATRSSQSARAPAGEPGRQRDVMRSGLGRVPLAAVLAVVALSVMPSLAAAQGTGCALHALGGERLAGAERALRAALPRQRRTRAATACARCARRRASTRPPTATAPTWSRAPTSPT